MADHDPMCPVLGVGYEAASFCYCERLRERDARVRADERARAQVQACDAHITQVRFAEAVAARLVEVICEDATAAREHKQAVSG